jgi:hypothetical protein
MKIINKITKTLVSTAFVIGILVGIGFAQTNLQQRITTTSFGMHSLAAGQSLRLSVVNLPLIPGGIVPCVRVEIVLNIYESSPTAANRLQFVRRISREVLVDENEPSSFNYSASRTGGEYVSVSTSARPLEYSQPENTQTEVTSTLELRENGRTVFTLPGVVKTFEYNPIIN